MQIEVTEKEARGIYATRYLNIRGKKNYIPPVILLVALIIAMAMMNSGYYWLGIIVFVLLSIPSVFLTLKSARASGQYAKKLIEEQK